MNVKSIKKSFKSKINLIKLSKKSDKDISYKDSPATTDEFWKDAKVLMPQHKVHISFKKHRAG